MTVYFPMMGYTSAVECIDVGDIARVRFTAGRQEMRSSMCKTRYLVT